MNYDMILEPHPDTVVECSWCHTAWLVRELGPIPSDEVEAFNDALGACPTCTAYVYWEDAELD